MENNLQLNSLSQKENPQIKIGNYLLTQDILAKGSFGTIYKGTHFRTGEHVAIKTELHHHNSLKHETRILQYLYDKKVKQIPQIYWYGFYETDSLKYQVLILPFYSCNLETYRQHKQMNSPQIFKLMIKIIDICQQIHSKYIVHRDIKPANFMIKNGEIYLIDFGLATFYIDEDSRPIADYTDSVGTMVGTLKYASLHIHNGHRYSPRDDLISLAYIYHYLMYGDIGWKPGVMPTEEYNTGIDRSDIMHPLNQLWKQSKMEHLQKIFAETETEKNMNCIMLHMVYALDYHEEPDYNKLKMLFTETI